MKEMIYLPKMDFDLLGTATHKGYRYCIISYGHHPCCYIELTEGRPYFNARDFEEVGLSCHGGITYVDWGLYRGKNGEPNQEIFPDSSKVIGWDYGHFGDFSGISLLSSNKYLQNEYKWTTRELNGDCIDVIEQLVLLQYPERFYS